VRMFLEVEGSETSDVMLLRFMDGRTLHTFPRGGQ